ncbi:helix-turn-helix domain-containing protein [Falsihalocynthiibacter arcticus]|uniref:Helix-turn-helix domain-containing protein n=1 Tax=Falsihalocynthiibacter arcticus TaxID=1579316 RepID=A0A126UZY0_9RHOB|nr:helix-turn-helix domain-containing protein [Falsihalocynthiibacter arcticus]AML51632.1 hypothetical protein RC74_10480 [Falsihalocynthiibacter arcticus]
MKRPKYYTTNQVADIFGKHPRTIRDWILTGCLTPDGLVKLEAAKFGKSWQVRDVWLVLFEHRVRPDDGRPDLDLE